MFGGRTVRIAYQSSAALRIGSVAAVTVGEIDWTARVEQTWEICRRRVRRSGVRWLAGLINRDSAMFLDRFETILNAYRSGAMRYGCLIAEKIADASCLHSREDTGSAYRAVSRCRDTR
jgi:hypothetical protein